MIFTPVASDVPCIMWAVEYPGIDTFDSWVVATFVDVPIKALDHVSGLDPGTTEKAAAYIDDALPDIRKALVDDIGFSDTEWFEYPEDELKADLPYLVLSGVVLTAYLWLESEGAVICEFVDELDRWFSPDDEKKEVSI